jgi:hypothetical protein
LPVNVFFSDEIILAKIYDQIFDQAILSSSNLFDQTIDFYQIMNKESYYKDIAYVVLSSG